MAKTSFKKLFFPHWEREQHSGAPLHFLGWHEAMFSPDLQPGTPCWPPHCPTMTKHLCGVSSSGRGPRWISLQVFRTGEAASGR